MKLQEHRLDVWLGSRPIVEADKVINLPVAKDHILSSMTLGMKNWFGAIGEGAARSTEKYIQILLIWLSFSKLAQR